MLEWLCRQLMEAEISQQLGVEKSERAESRNGYVFVAWSYVIIDRSPTRLHMFNINQEL